MSPLIVIASVRQMEDITLYPLISFGYGHPIWYDSVFYLYHYNSIFIAAFRLRETRLF